METKRWTSREGLRRAAERAAALHEVFVNSTNRCSYGNSSDLLVVVVEL